MQSSSVPPKFTIPWANSAGGANIRSIPTASQISIQAGAASLTDGFPPINFVPVSAGGVPPFGQDMNGILKQTTQWTQWQAAAGPVHYDGGFAAAVNGYPSGALLLSNSGHAVYQNLVDNNAGDPNGGAINWRVASSVWSATTWLASGSANAQTVTLSPAPTALSQLTGIPLRIFSQGANTGAATLNINNLGPVAIVVPGGVQLANGSLLTGYPFEIVLQGTASFVLMSRTNTFFDNATSGVIIQGSNTAGANLEFIGNGVTTPNKYLRAFNGLFQILNSTYGNSILALTDAGALSVTSDITSGGNFTASGSITGSVVNSNTSVTANGGRLRATAGTTSSGDANAAPILFDFQSGSGPNGSWFSLPSLGLTSSDTVIVQCGSVGVPETNTPTTFNLPRAFPSAFLGIIISYGANLPPTAGAIGASPLGLSQFQATDTSSGPSNHGTFFIAVGW